MIVRLPYGRDGLTLDLRGLRVNNLRPEGPSGVRDPAEAVGRAVDRPLDGPPLGDLARGRRSAVVVVPDATRWVDLGRTLPPLLHRLEGAGIAPDRQRVLVACGTHPPVSGEELVSLVGDLPRETEVLQHDSRSEDSLVPAGRLESGATLRLNRWAVETDLLVTMSVVRHHYFAGFGGGPKMIFPGLAGYDEIQANHSRVLERTDRGWRRHPACEPGVLEGNPVAAEIAAAADLRPPDLALCLAPGVDRGFAGAFAGSWRTAWGAAVDRVRASFEVGAEAFDLVVASGGGWPGDRTLIQAHKGLDAACRFAAPGGEVAFAAALTGGLGSPDMEEFVDDPRPEAILERLGERWVQYGHTTLRLVEKTAAFDVKLVSGLEENSARRLGFEPFSSLDDVAAGWRERCAGAVVGVMSGPAVFPNRKFG